MCGTAALGFGCRAGFVANSSTWRFRLRDSLAARWPESGTLILLAKSSICGNRTANKRHQAGDRGRFRPRGRSHLACQKTQGDAREKAPGPEDHFTNDEGNVTDA